jgi:branched-chain amino acid transport system permease protein
LRDNRTYAMSRGIGPFKYQLWLFALSAFFTGLAGAFYAIHFRVVGPTVFSFPTLLFLLAMIVVGGIGSTWGPVLGAALLMLADEGMREFPEIRDIGLGLVTALFIILCPRGVIGWRGPLGSAWGRLRIRRPAGS